MNNENYEGYGISFKTGFSCNVTNLRFTHHPLLDFIQIQIQIILRLLYDLYEFLSSAEHKEDILNNVGNKTVSGPHCLLFQQKKETQTSFY